MRDQINKFAYGATLGGLFGTALGNVVCLALHRWNWDVLITPLAITACFAALYVITYPRRVA